ncbi:uncharacterized protein LOC108863812 [Galendromus occidentalis]|uniref:Uncharacterized protein LOC108863812 n=1 Tax=Galendromus occidentalis TaxID=34638 RepID=A0AAJ7SDI6_9ACAR|nr:uncharacterized protein LOC108863812 [Galendromus occidentalis]
MFCTLMELRPFHQENYDGACSDIGKAAANVAKICMEKASREELQRTTEARAFQDPRAVAVSVDCAWARRGFSSLFGPVAVVGERSNKVLDVTVKSLHFSICPRWRSDQESAEFDDLMEEHSPECQINHEGSSGSMESRGAVELFQRSLETRGLIHKHYIGDGNSAETVIARIIDMNKRPMPNMDSVMLRLARLAESESAKK